MNILGETLSVKEEVSLPTLRVCSRCKFVSSQEVCKACVLLEGLNKGLPKLGIGKSSKAKKMLEEYNAKQKAEIDKLNDEFKKNNCISKGKVCKSKCNNKANNCKNNECNDTCKCTTELNLPDNPKINKLLEEYGLQDDDQDSGISQDLTKNGDTDELEENTCAGACGGIDGLSIAFWH